MSEGFQYHPITPTPNPKPKNKLVEAVKAVANTGKHVINKLFHKESKIGRILRPRKANPTLKDYIIHIAIIIGAITAAGATAAIILIALISFTLPNIHDLDKLSVAQSTTIYDREGNVIYVKYAGENRQYVKYDQISKDVVNATVAIEDEKFWEHGGFDIFGIARAVVNNLTGGSRQGGSTLTQQYIKNAFLSPEKSYIRKIKELILSVQLERAFDKEQIIELYLNKIPYGNNAFGVEKAAQVYFDSHAENLTLAQASIIASLPKAPSYYNPYGPHRNSELTTTFDSEEVEKRNITSEKDLKENEFQLGLIGQNIQIGETRTIYIKGRTDLVLRAMKNNGYITEAEEQQALEELQTIEFKKRKEDMNAPHFVFYIINELEEKYGKEIVEQGGLNVYTTLDPKLQEYAETAIKDGVERNKERFNAKNSALVSLSPQTGEILSMVGSVDYFSEEIDGAVNITTQYRQPGSSFKPIIFAQAFYNRYSPSSIIFDVETKFGSSAYPKNYDGKFTGPISIRRALAQSRNIPAIKAYFLGGEQKPIIQLAQKMGITFLDPDRDYGWPLALGAAEVKPLEIASAFGVFANNGILHKPRAILKITNAQGEIMEEWNPADEESKGEEALDPQIAYLISDILSDRSVSLGGNLQLGDHQAAVKTGTSNIKDGEDYYPRDLWTIGYTKHLVTAVWSGNNKASDGRLSAAADGYSGSAPIWKQFMTSALEGKPAETFTEPEGIKRIAVSKTTGLLPGPNTPEEDVIEEVFASFAVPTDIDTGYTTAKIDERNSKLANEYCPEKFVKEITFINLHALAPYESWEEGVQKWIAENITNEEGEFNNITIGAPPTQESEICTKSKYQYRPEVKIKSPKNNSEVKIGEALKVKTNIKAENGIEKVEFFLDDTFKYSAEEQPYEGIIRLPRAEKDGTTHIISVKATDEHGYTETAEITITTKEKPRKNSGDSNDDDSPDSNSDTDEDSDSDYDPNENENSNAESNSESDTATEPTPEDDTPIEQPAPNDNRGTLTTEEYEEISTNATI